MMDFTDAIRKIKGMKVKAAPLPLPLQEETNKVKQGAEGERKSPPVQGKG